METNLTGKEYVVTSKMLRNYLNSLGLYYRTDEDKEDKTKEVYLFENNNKLKEALEFYSQFKYKRNK